MRVAMLALAFVLAISGPVAAGPYEDGMAALERADYALAAQWLRKAADQGHASAQFNLGVMYGNGQGVPQDYTQAVQWYRKAADQGNADAQTNLGHKYANGQGVPQDYALAYMWFNLSAASASDADVRERGKKARDDIAARMTPAQIGEAQRLSREWKPTSQR